MEWGTLFRIYVGQTGEESFLTQFREAVEILEEPALVRDPVRFQKIIPPGYTVAEVAAQDRADQGHVNPSVDFLAPDPKNNETWANARIVGIRKARPHKSEWYDSALIEITHRPVVPAVLVGAKGLRADFHILLGGIWGKPEYLTNPCILEVGKDIIALAWLFGLPVTKGMTFAQLGAAMGISRQAANRRIHRMRNRLYRNQDRPAASRFIRSFPDPRKGMTLAEIQARPPRRGKTRTGWGGRTPKR